MEEFPKLDGRHPRKDFVRFVRHLPHKLEKEGAAAVPPNWAAVSREIMADYGMKHGKLQRRLSKAMRKIPRFTRSPK